MPTLQATDIADLVTTTLNELGEMKFTDLMSDYRNTIALKRVFKAKKTTFDAGPEIQFNIITDHNDSADWKGLYESDNVNPNDVMTTGKIPWRHISWNWAIERREIAMNRSPRKIVDLAKTRRIAALGSAIIKFERALWRCPAVTDVKTCYGIPYYIVKSNTAATLANNDGFNGTVPSGYTTVANINPTTGANGRFVNYATQYTNVTKSDLIVKMRRAMAKTDFKALVDDIPQYSVGRDMGLYTNYDTLAQLEGLLEAQNENLGTDLASMDGRVMFRRVGVTDVDELKQDSTQPIYGINWSELGTVGLRGEWMNETTEPRVAGQHTVSATFTDCSFNLLCRNRRKQFVLSTNTTMPS